MFRDFFFTSFIFTTESSNYIGITRCLLPLFYSLRAITIDSESSRVATIGIARCLLPSLWGRGKGEGLLGRVSERWFFFLFYLTTLKFCFAQALVQRLKCHHSVRKGMKPAALITSRRSLRLANASREIRRRAMRSFSLSI